MTENLYISQFFYSLFYFTLSAGYYLVENAQQQDFDATFIPLSREKRHPGEKKSVDPEEDKSKVTKKPTYFDAKSINIVPGIANYNQFPTYRVIG